MAQTQVIASPAFGFIRHRIEKNLPHPRVEEHEWIKRQPGLHVPHRGVRGDGPVVFENFQRRAEVPAEIDLYDPIDARAAGQASAGESISGTITVSPSLGRAPGGGVIFVIVRPAGVNAGPPLAVRRLRNSGFPLKYEVSEANVMIRGMPFQGSVNVTVRLDGDGRVGSQPGDLEGRAKQPVQVGDTSVDIVLDKRR